jgi:citrate synthase
MDDHVKLVYNGKTHELPVVVGSEGERAIDITRLRTETGFIRLIPGYANSGACQSSITYMDGEKGFCGIGASPLKSLPSSPLSRRRPTS